MRTFEVSVGAYEILDNEQFPYYLVIGVFEIAKFKMSESEAYNLIQSDREIYKFLRDHKFITEEIGNYEFDIRPVNLLSMGHYEIEVSYRRCKEYYPVPMYLIDIKKVRRREK